MCARLWPASSCGSRSPDCCRHQPAPRRSWVCANSVTALSRVLLEIVTVPQLLKIFPVCLENGEFVTFFTRPTACPSSGPDESRLHHYPLSFRSILISYSHPCHCLPNDIRPSVSPPKPCVHFTSFPYMPHGPPISFYFIWSAVIAVTCICHCVKFLTTGMCLNKNETNITCLSTFPLHMQAFLLHRCSSGIQMHVQFVGHNLACCRCTSNVWYITLCGYSWLISIPTFTSFVS